MSTCPNSPLILLGSITVDTEWNRNCILYCTSLPSKYTMVVIKLNYVLLPLLTSGGHTVLIFLNDHVAIGRCDLRTWIDSKRRHHDCTLLRYKRLTLEPARTQGLLVVEGDRKLTMALDQSAEADVDISSAWGESNTLFLEHQRAGF